MREGHALWRSEPFEIVGIDCWVASAFDLRENLSESLT